jgi:transposase
LVEPYLALISEDAPQREHDLREIYNALRWIVRSGGPWRMIRNDLPPWAAIHQQVQRWIKPGIFDDMVHDLREVLRISVGREEQPTAVVIDSRTLLGLPESGHRAGYYGAKRRKGSKIHIAVDTIGHLLALHVTPIDKQN